ncbi:DUF397 domain-containing protein [Streptomyces sp. NPDC048370]|uniref:DUF397 domain-containing protein n=1 Tax=Streptomyces sp. NPDC048370 TaxID=3365540 RepID=UPI0037108349
MASELGDIVWRKSSYSGGGSGGGDCVEVADLVCAAAVRDSKCASGPVLRFGAGSWQAFLEEVQAPISF